jgi:glycerol-3-phosphate dehydrogenase
MRKYFDIKIEKSDILSSWCGLRPLVSLEHTENTKEVVREHYIETSKSSLVSIAGGKWTTYRKMSEEVVDKVDSILKLDGIEDCKTQEYKLQGSHIELSSVEGSLKGLCEDKAICEHLLKTYGALALDVLEYAKKYGFKRLHANYDIIEAEVHYALEHEFVQKPLDFLVRRVGLGLIDIDVAKEVLSHVATIFGEYFSWDKDRYDIEVKNALKHFDENKI